MNETTPPTTKPAQAPKPPQSKPAQAPAPAGDPVRTLMLIGPTEIIGRRDLATRMETGTKKLDGMRTEMFFEADIQHIRVEVTPKDKTTSVTMVPMARVSSWEPG